MMDDLTAFQRDLLYVVAGLGEDERPYGLAIKREIERHYEDPVNHGQLYPNLDALVDHGFVEKGTIDRRTNSYELTESGRRALEARREWEAEYLDALP